VRFASGGAPPTRHLAVEVQMRGPDEPRLVAELTRLGIENGGEAAANRLMEMASSGSKAYVPSYVPGNAFFSIREAKKSREAVAVLEAGIRLFPRNSFLLTRMGEMAVALKQNDKAIDFFRRAVEADPLNRVAAVQLAKLGAPR
jgi:predicted Zn-dependent protease